MAQELIYFMVAINLIFATAMILTYIKNSRKRVKEPEQKISEPIRCGVALISTDKADIRWQIVVHEDERMTIASCHQGKKFDYRQAHELYFFSEREIEEGDWMTDGDEIYKNKVKLDAYIGLYKIEASTDKNLTEKTEYSNMEPYTMNTNIVKISKLFIEDYVKSKGKIKIVKIESEIEDGNIVVKKTIDGFVKVNSKL